METPGRILMIWPAAATQRVMPREGSEGSGFFDSVISSKEEITGRWLRSLWLYSNLPLGPFGAQEGSLDMSCMAKGSKTEQAPSPHCNPSNPIGVILQSKRHVEDVVKAEMERTWSIPVGSMSSHGAYKMQEVRAKTRDYKSVGPGEGVGVHALVMEEECSRDHVWWQ